MKRDLALAVIGGIGCRAVGRAMTEMAKQDITASLTDRVALYAWDSDPRDLKLLCEEELYAPACCLAALRESRLDDGFAELVRLPTGGEAPLWVVCTLTSRNFESALESIGKALVEAGQERRERGVLLWAIADQSQDPKPYVREDFRKRRHRGFGMLGEKVNDPTFGNVKALVFSRDALTSTPAAVPDGRDGHMDGNSKERFMRCLQHIIWLILTAQDPSATLRELHGAIPSGGGSWQGLGHVQINDDAGREADHTLMDEETARDAIRNDHGKITIRRWNRLFSRNAAALDGRPIWSIAFSDKAGTKRCPAVEIEGANCARPEPSYLIDRLDVLVAEAFGEPPGV